MISLSVLLHEWVFRLGDGTFWGWLITALYGITIAGSLYYIHSMRRSTTPEKTIRICITVVLVLLGVNKQLDLQTLIIVTGRMIAAGHGWMVYRRTIQEFFAIGILLCVGVAGLVVILRLRRCLLHVWLECTGITILLGFAIIRTASINHIGWVTVLEDTRLQHIHAFELAGLLCIMAALYINIAKQRNRDR
jgi:hypothetical protein